METTRMDLLVTLDEHYLPQLRVMLTSLRLSHPGVQCRVYLLHRSIPEERLAALESGLAGWGYQLVLIRVDEAVFQDAPVTDRYPQEMYYRLLAARFLPEELKRVLYLDPDTLVINSLLPLWELELDGHLFAAAAHTGKTEIANNVNRFRLGTEGDYYNSGVLLMDLERCRNEIHTEELFDYVSNHGDELILPDQDILNALYGGRVLAVDDFIWNYDARNFSNYLVRSMGEADLDWVMAPYRRPALLRQGEALEKELPPPVPGAVPPLYELGGQIPAGSRHMSWKGPVHMDRALFSYRFEWVSV